MWWYLYFRYTSWKYQVCAWPYAWLNNKQKYHDLCTFLLQNLIIQDLKISNLGLTWTWLQQWMVTHGQHIFCCKIYSSKTLKYQTNRTRSQVLMTWGLRTRQYRDQQMWPILWKQYIFCKFVILVMSYLFNIFPTLGDFGITR